MADLDRVFVLPTRPQYTIVALTFFGELRGYSMAVEKGLDTPFEAHPPCSRFCGPKTAFCRCRVLKHLYCVP